MRQHTLRHRLPCSTDAVQWTRFAAWGTSKSKTAPMHRRPIPVRPAAPSRAHRRPAPADGVEILAPGQQFFDSSRRGCDTGIQLTLREARQRFNEMTMLRIFQQYFTDHFA